MEKAMSFFAISPPVLMYALFHLAHVIIPGANAQTPPLGSCYYPDGSWAQNQYPCDGHQYIAFCCPSGWSCYSNMLCVVTDPSTANTTFPIGTTSQATCTDPTWSDGSCGSFCQNNAATDSQGLVLTACGDDKYCCPSDDTCTCESGQGTFSVATGSLQTIISHPGASYTSTPSHKPSSSTSTSLKSSTSSSSSVRSTTSSVISASTTSVSSTTTRTSTSSSPISTTSSSTSSVGVLTTSSISPSSTPSTMMSSTSSSSDANESSTSSSATSTASVLPAGTQHTSVTDTTGFKAGIAVAAIVVAAVLIGLLLCCFLRRRKRHSKPDPSESSPPMLARSNPGSFTPSPVSQVRQNPTPPAMTMVSDNSSRWPADDTYTNSITNTVPNPYPNTNTVPNAYPIPITVPDPYQPGHTGPNPYQNRATGPNPYQNRNTGPNPYQNRNTIPNRQPNTNIVPGMATRDRPPNFRARMAEMGPEIYPEVVPVPREATLPNLRSPSSTLRIVNKTPSPPQTPTTRTSLPSPPPMYNPDPAPPRAPPHGAQNPVSPLVADGEHSTWPPPVSHAAAPQHTNANGMQERTSMTNRQPVHYYDGSEDYYPSS